MKIRTILSILLVLVIALTVPAQAMAADKKPAYVSDVMVGMGETADEAKKALTDAGYTVLDQNVNEGAGSVMKTDKYVYLGYKTTENAAEAITDLATMNMNGGYSFSDYEALMDKYRDSQIKPFIDKFIATINEFRENYKSDNEGNKAKADYAYAILNNFRDDDTGSLMGDLLLNPTKEERGLTDDQYKALSDEEKQKTINLTTALMQGNSQIILLIEQILAMAADTNETTWLERLSEMGPDGLEQKYAEKGIRPTDAKKEMASLYDDTAKIILGSWDELRNGLLDYDATMSKTKSTSKDKGDIDVSDLTQFDVSNKGESELNLDKADEMVPYYTQTMENSNAIAEEAVNHTFDGIYHVLKGVPYGEGTMYDFFTKPYPEVSGENISTLYPMVSTLTAGQTAAIEFLNTTVLAQIGATVGDAFEQFSADNSDMFEALVDLDNVSLYYAVNREIFGDKTALTSDLMRNSALTEKAFGLTDPLQNLGGLSALSAISWAATSASLLMTVVSASKYTKYANLINDTSMLSKMLHEHLSYSEKFSNRLQILQDMVDMESDDAMYLMDVAAERTEYALRVVNQDGKYVYKLSVDLVWGKEAGRILDGLKNTDALDKMDYYRLYDMEDVRFIELDSAGSFKDLRLTAKDLGELENKLEDACTKCSFSKTQKIYKGMKIAFGVVFAVLAITSVALSVYDLYRYFNINYTPIPKYIVDEADITTLDADGNKLVNRNDAAYYTVASTNRPENHKQYKSLQDYADLNGDVGKEWLALYYAKNSSDAPILADSFTVVIGSASMPGDYTRSIHMFGSDAAMNLTDSNYTYNDDLNGLYIYFKTDAAASTDTASAFSGGMLALVGVGGAVVGAAIGALVTVLIKRKKKPQEAE